jgi:hypothetical protein
MQPLIDLGFAPMRFGEANPTLRCRGALAKQTHRVDVEEGSATGHLDKFTKHKT